MEYSKDTSFESREYQQELYTQAIENNLILYLPTGSGKTFIATLLIRHFNSNKFLTPIENGGQRTFFLVNTVALVEQQAKQIRAQTILPVGTYSGDIGVDLWPREVWMEELNKHQILVMTAQIFVDLLHHNTISLSNVNLLIFDECHRAVSNHPMRQAMMAFKGVPSSKQPRILGLTATLLNGNVKANDIQNEIRILETTMLSKISTSDNEDMVKMYSTNPKEAKISYQENDTTGFCYKLRDQLLERLKGFVAEVQIEEVVLPAPTSAPHGATYISDSNKKINKRIKNMIDDIKVNMDDLGEFGGSLAILAHLVQIQQMMPNCQLETSMLLYQSIIADCTLLRKYIDNETKRLGLPDALFVRKFSSDKVNKFLKILRTLGEKDSAIVFVRRRFTAKILYYLIKKSSELDPSLKNVKASFIVGYNIGNPFKDTRENYMQRHQNKKVMNQFNQGIINVLFASNVVEEGIDITQCNFVIMFDPPQDFRAYIQSKGRARDQNSNYIIMTSLSDSKIVPLIESFRGVERVLKKILYGGKTKDRELPSKEEIDKSLFMETPGLEPFKPLGPDGPVVTCLSAVSLINRYFASLKTDKFTKIAPHVWMDQELNKFKCYLLLPMESSISGMVEGTWQSNKEDAKRSVALEACKKLYESGELGAYSMLPILLNDSNLNVNTFMPNVCKDEIFEMEIGNKIVKLGTKKNKRTYQKEWAACLCTCRPQPNKKVYLHVLEMKPIYAPPPDNNRLTVIHEILSMANSFALISSKTLPKIAAFPLYTNTGELIATVKESNPIYLDEEQIKKIDDFHYSLFNNALHLVKDFMIKDNSDSLNSFLIAPVKKIDVKSEFVIDWEAIKETCKPFPKIYEKPSDEERMSLKITDKNYLLKIATPWYRTVPLQMYLITNVCHDMSEDTKFPTENYASYKKYFKDKYNIEPLVKKQPLIEVKPLTSRINCTKPRALSKIVRKSKLENEDYDMWLLPEYCHVFPLDGKYWLKAQLLPTALYRISRLCLAEELRVTISKDTNLGPLTLPQGKNWKALEEDISLRKKVEKPDVQQQALKPLSIMSKTPTASSSTQNLWNEEEPLDIERNMDTASIFDIINYDNFINKPLCGLSGPPGSSRSKLSSITKKQPIKMISPPKLKMLQNDIHCFGPEQVEVMQALTVAVANDFVNCERLETLGDSFLKFAISLILFETQQDVPEGHLSYIKGAIVGNKNLYFCGKKKKLGSLLQVQDFSPNEEWVAPGFCVEHGVKNVICTAKLDSDLLYNIKIPEKDRRAGVLGEEIRQLLNSILLNAEDEKIGKNCTFINQQAVTDKNISDAVEALLGVYLKNFGIFGALSLMNWFGVTNNKLSTTDIMTRKARPPAKGKGNPEVHLLQPGYLEDILNYKFNDRCYMLQALTHPSYSKNNITNNYQRLEFLGDAVIDFLITIHIFEKCETLSPGDLTDLRSALVNNITLGALSVKYELHKFMQFFSSKLNDCIMRFVKHQEERNHLIDDDILFLIEEKEINISESVDVPKALGDVFEALIGAIYLDSGKNLDITWKVIYNLMKNEIETFSKCIPKNHVRMLYETNCCPFFTSKLDDNGAVMVSVEICHNGVKQKFYGFGDNKFQAKRASAKHALRYIRLNTC